MTLLTLYNSLTQKIEPFESIEDRKVKMFTCGPSIYQRPHIGNYRTFLFEDILQRYLEYSDYTVIRALNFTDIEDKSVLEAKKHNTDALRLTQKYGHVFFNDLKLLKIQPPTYNPKSSTSIDEVVSLIQKLLKRGHAYWHNKNVYFDFLKYEEFGKLGRPDKSHWPKSRRRYHKDTYPGNYWNLGDFILWHGYQEGDTIYWDTAIGKGRSSWNVQDPAMVAQTLGYSIDIYCGGEDNLIRHHDYTIAIAESASGKPLARYWLHGAHLQINAKKMSKSKGNVLYPDDLVKSGYSSEEIRFVLMYGHYRKRLNYTEDKIKKSSEKLAKAHELIDVIGGADGSESDGSVNRLIEHLKLDFEQSMDDDLNVKQAFDGMLAILLKLGRLTRKNRLTSEDAKRVMDVLAGIDGVLQVLQVLSVEGTNPKKD